MESGAAEPRRQGFVTGVVPFDTSFKRFRHDIRISDDQRIQLDALQQDKYYADQTFASSIGLKVLATLIAVIMGVGSCFAVMNMMYGAVSARQQEVATLRALGFRRRNILGSFLFESAVLAHDLQPGQIDQG